MIATTKTEQKIPISKVTSSMDNEVRNLLTEHDTSHKLINTYLLDCYAGLSPNSLTKISVVIFNFLLNSKKYIKKTSAYYSEDEDKRIYTNVVLNPKDIVKRCNPAKPYVTESELDVDAGNLIRRLNDIDEMNIFYMWKCGYPHVYMFIMERDIGVWKFYNSSGYVIPRTMKKILASHSAMINAMSSMLKSQNQSLSNIEISSSYGQFINRMIEKMNPETSKSIKKWDGVTKLDGYIEELSDTLKKMDQFEGMIETPDFLDKLPPNVSEKLKIKPNNKATDSKTVENKIDKAITPEDENIIKIRTPKPIKVDDVTSSTVRAKPSIGTSINPFKNCNEFIKFYRKILNKIHEEISFFQEVNEAERSAANEILDMLILSARENDSEFLKAWISYYSSKYLKGNDSENVYKTSLNAFKKSFAEYNKKYIG